MSPRPASDYHLRYVILGSVEQALKGSSKLRRIHPEDEIGFVLVGLGVRGRQWQQVISNHQQARIIAAVEVDEEAGRGSEFPVYASLEEALTLAPHGVVIASPPTTHHSLVTTAIGAGVPVLCEKPLSEDLPEAIEMAELADEEGIPLIVGMNFRYTESALRLRELVHTQQYGRPIVSSFTYVRNRDGRRRDLNDYPLEMDQPMLVEQSIHHFDLMRFVYSREVESVIACTWNPSTSVYAGDSCVAAILTFSEDFVVSYLGTWTSGSAKFNFNWRTDFEWGFAFQNDQFGSLVAGTLDASASAVGPLFNDVGERGVVVAERTRDPFIDDTQALFDHFCDVVTGEIDSITSGLDHLHTLGLLDAIKTSAEAGRAVDISTHLEALGIHG